MTHSSSTMRVERPISLTEFSDESVTLSNNISMLYIRYLGSESRYDRSTDGYNTCILSPAVDRLLHPLRHANTLLIQSRESFTSFNLRYSGKLLPGRYYEEELGLMERPSSQTISRIVPREPLTKPFYRLAVSITRPRE